MNRIVFILLIFATVLSCGKSEKEMADKIYQDRAHLLATFQNRSLINRGENVYLLRFHAYDTGTAFLFSKKDDTWTLQNDSLLIATGAGKDVTKEFNRLLGEIKKYGITAVSPHFSTHGVNLKFYLPDYRAVLYVSNPEGITNPHWTDYIRSGSKLGDNWYFVKDEIQ